MSEQELPDGEFADIERLTGGTQNILVRFRRGEGDYVLRRPPRHLPPHSSDKLRREARVLGARTGQPVVALIAACSQDTCGVPNAARTVLEPARSSPQLRRLVEHVHIDQRHSDSTDGWGSGPRSQAEVPKRCAHSFGTLQAGRLP